MKILISLIIIVSPFILAVLLSGILIETPDTTPQDTTAVVPSVTTVFEILPVEIAVEATPTFEILPVEDTQIPTITNSPIRVNQVQQIEPTSLEENNIVNPTETELIIEATIPPDVTTADIGMDSTSILLTTLFITLTSGFLLYLGSILRKHKGK
ncbi:MAG: hypothetical protein QY330_00305 [Candidatus Dojkabacteria bacterium]|uniref:Uncharacterized protein n=1 Tax=candidate division WS6 bacterium OLB21 TaxID=1617427 RepID=A0A136KKG7_9BACT|nr:MAG: hypothetical protein UZ20_WS6002000246 [candidate division WS6 bacterium OLB21]WKZ28036.1 MAG: hypothetical protein QY330_00305 [Candidatus Dojkabacteria bacterium]